MIGIIMIMVCMFALMLLPMMGLGRQLEFLIFQFGYPIFTFLALGGIMALLFLSRGPARKLFRGGKGLLVCMASETGEIEFQVGKVMGNIVQLAKTHFGVLPKTIKGNPLDILNKRYIVKDLGRPILFGYSSKSVLFTPEHIKVAKAANRPSKKQNEILNDIKKIEQAAAKAKVKVDVEKGLLLTELELMEPRDIVNLTEETWPETLVDEAVYQGMQLERESRGPGAKIGQIILVILLCIGVCVAVVFMTEQGIIPS